METSATAVTVRIRNTEIIRHRQSRARLHQTLKLTLRRMCSARQEKGWNTTGMFKEEAITIFPEVLLADDGKSFEF